jgi:hypothetical protein
VLIHCLLGYVDPPRPRRPRGRVNAAAPPPGGAVYLARVAGGRRAQLCHEPTSVRIGRADCFCGCVGDAVLVHSVFKGAATQRDQRGGVVSNQTEALTVLQTNTANKQCKESSSQQLTPW